MSTNDNHALSQLAIEAAALVPPNASSAADRAADVIDTGHCTAQALYQHASAIRAKSEDLAAYAECLAEGIEARLKSFAAMIDAHALFYAQSRDKIANLVAQLADFDRPEEPPAASKTNGSGAAAHAS